MLDSLRQNPHVKDVLKIIADSWEHLKTKEGLILMTVLVGIVIWGPKGNPIFSGLLSGWLGSEGTLTHNWHEQLLSYGTGILILVIIPMLLIRFRMKESFAEFGLGLGDKKLGIVFMLLLIGVCLPFFYFGSSRPDMWTEYPLLYKGMSVDQIKAAFTWKDFLLYELIYSTFFFTIEFVYRAYLLFGLRRKFGEYAILFQMLSYTAWHLPKPLTELAGTPLWGFATAAVTLKTRSVWYVFIAHWLLNIFIDTSILYHRGIISL